MNYGESLVEKGAGDDNELYLGNCRGCLNICPILEYSRSNCHENLLRQMYSYNDNQNTCCLMRRSYSANVPFISAVQNKQITKTIATSRIINSWNKKPKVTNCNGNSESTLVESDSEDSDAEFAVHECLRDLIKSRSVQAFQTKTQPIPTSRPLSNIIPLTSNEVKMTLDQKNAVFNRSRSSSSASSNAVGLHRTVTAASELHSPERNLKKDNLNHDLLSYWSAPDYSDMNNFGGEIDDTDRFSESDSPKDYCWSAPDLASEDLYEAFDESCEQEQMLPSKDRERLSSLPSSIFSDYDEPKRPSFLALDGREGEHMLNCANKRVPQFPKSLALEESYNSMDIYVASPSPQREYDTKEIYETFVEKKAPGNSTSPSAIDFIDSPDESNDIPFGYEHFVAKINAMKEKFAVKAASDLSSRTIISVNADHKCLKSNTGDLDSSDHDAKARDGNDATDTAVQYQQRLLKNFDEAICDEDRTSATAGVDKCLTSNVCSVNDGVHIKEVLKRFTGFKPFTVTSEEVNNILESEFNKSNETMHTDKMDKSNLLPAPSSVSANVHQLHSTHRVSGVDHSKEDSDMLKELHNNDVQAITYSSTTTERSDDERLDVSASSNTSKLLPTANNCIWNRLKPDTPKIRRSATEYHLSDDSTLVKQEVCSGECHLFINSSTRVPLKKSNTAVNISRTFEQTDISTSGRRRLPVAPNKDVETTHSLKGSYHSITESTECEVYSNNLIFEQQTSAQQQLQKARIHSPTQLPNWTSTTNEFCSNMIASNAAEASSYVNGIEFVKAAATGRQSEQLQQQHVYAVESAQYQRAGADQYTPASPPDVHFIYHKESQECIPCYGQSCFSSIYTPLPEMAAAFTDDLTNRLVANKSNLQRPKSLPFNGHVRSTGLQQRNNPLNVGHRQLPALPVTSKHKELLFDIGHYTVTPALNSGHHQYCLGKTVMAEDYPPAEDHRICFDTESVMEKSTSLIDGSYFEDNSISGNYYTESKAIALYSQDDSSGISSCCTGSEHQTSTHRVHSPFIPRHDDEVLLEVGDAVHVEREYDDHWCYGTNLRTGQQGIFPVAHVCEIDFPYESYSGLPSTNLNPGPSERDTFYLTMLASIEVAHHKGNDVLIQAMNKVLSLYKNKEEFVVPVTVVMEISFRGIHIIDKSKKNLFQCPNFDFFYSLQNISFCGAHPKQLRYFGFITKHPILPRFACHVFLSSKSTQVIVDAIGKAFKRSYDEYMAFAHPTEDIYLE